MVAFFNIAFLIVTNILALVGLHQFYNSANYMWLVDLVANVFICTIWWYFIRPIIHKSFVCPPSSKDRLQGNDEV